jgi:hypothetical protein
MVYLSRNYLILGVLGLMGISFLIILGMANSGSAGVAGFLGWMHTLVSAAALIAAIMIVYNPIKDRTVKMIITKPCLPEEWAASSFLTVNLISVTLHVIILLFVFLIYALHPGAVGIDLSTYLYMWISSVIAVMIFSSLILFLTFFMPPVLAVIVMLLMNNVFIVRLMDFCFNYTGNIVAAIFYKIAGGFLYIVYLVAPYFSTENMAQAAQSADKDWPHLLTFAVYGFVTLGFYYLLSVFTVKNRNLI